MFDTIVMDKSSKTCRKIKASFIFFQTSFLPSDHLLLDSAPNLGPLISRWEIKKFENCRYKSVRIWYALKLLFQQFLNLSSSQGDMSDPRLGALSNNRWSGGTTSSSIFNELRRLDHRPYTWRWLFSGIRELHDNFKLQFAFQQWHSGLRIKSWI
jgi:hypothetical protein